MNTIKKAPAGDARAKIGSREIFKHHFTGLAVAFQTFIRLCPGILSSLLLLAIAIIAFLIHGLRLVLIRLESLYGLIQDRRPRTW